MSFQHFLHNITHPFVVVFDKVFGEDARKQFEKAAEALLDSDLGKIAWAAVNAAETLLVDGAGKRAAAFAEIAREAAKVGIEFKDAIVNLLIELSVHRLKGAK